MVAGHELFGHGSGKLIYRDEKTGKCPMKVADPLNPSEFITSCYEKGDSYTPKFGDISSSYEECRADLSGLWLSTYPEMYSLFNWNAANSSDLLYLNLLHEARKGILGMQSSYNADQKKWKQAHTQGAFVISQFILQNQKTEVLKIVNTTKDDFYIEVNKTNLMTEGHELIGQLLHAL